MAYVLNAKVALLVSKGAIFAFKKRKHESITPPVPTAMFRGDASVCSVFNLPSVAHQAVVCLVDHGWFILACHTCRISNFNVNRVMSVQSCSDGLRWGHPKVASWK